MAYSITPNKPFVEFVKKKYGLLDNSKFEDMSKAAFTGGST